MSQLANTSGGGKSADLHLQIIVRCEGAELCRHTSEWLTYDIEQTLSEAIVVVPVGGEATTMASGRNRVFFRSRCASFTRRLL